MAYLLLHPQDLEGTVDMADAIEAIERAYGEAATFPVVNAPRQRIHSPGGIRFNTFPGGIPGLNVIGVVEHAERLIQDGERQLFADREHQICLLHDASNSALLGILIGAISERSVGYTTQTALRTGATSGVGFKHMARENSQICALFGAGDQAVTQLFALTRVRPIREVRLCTRTEASRLRFAQTYGPKFGVEIRPMDDPEAAIRGADVVLAATNTNVPVIKGAWLEPGQHVSSIVGSNIALVKAGWLDAPRRELDDDVIARADVIAVNSREQVIKDEQGDLFQPIEAGIVTMEEIAELGEVANGSRPGRTADDQITLHKNNTGLGVADIAVAHVAFERAKANGLGTWIDLEKVPDEDD